MTASRKTACCILILILGICVHETRAEFNVCSVCQNLFECNRSNIWCNLSHQICARKCPTDTSAPSSTETTTAGITAATPMVTSTTAIPMVTPTTTTPFGQCGISSVTGPANELISPKIVGGTPSQECEFPWTVLIITSRSFCGGAILDSKHVITAVHCLRQEGPLARPESLRVGYGTNNIQNLTFVNVTKIADHSEFTFETYNNDIAILTIDGSISYSSCVRPLCLPSATQTFEASHDCIVVGWGYTKEKSGTSQQILRKITVPIVTREECQKSYGEFRVTEGQICAGKGGKDACNGDSGGPLICASGEQWILAGIVSSGRGCARAGSPGIYTNVPYFISWIQERL